MKLLIIEKQKNIVFLSRYPQRRYSNVNFSFR